MKYIFYISLLFFSITSCTKENTCKDLHEGNFGYTDAELSHIEIKRSGDSQVEINTETKVETYTHIEWISDCEYIITYEKFENAPEELNFMIGKKINAEIVEVNGERFTCQMISEHTDERIDYKIID